MTAISSEFASKLQQETRFLPFSRVDCYGALGISPQLPLEYLRLALMSVLLVPIRLLFTILCFFSYYLLCQLMRYTLPKAWSHPACITIVSFHSRLALLISGVNVTWRKVTSSSSSASQSEDEAEQQQQQQEQLRNEWSAGSIPPGVGGIISNHCSLFDTVIFMWWFCPAFVAKRGTEKVPMLGYFADQVVKCIYVDRREKTTAPPVLDYTTTTTAGSAGGNGNGNGGGGGVGSLIKARMIANAAAGSTNIRPLLLFPEGTTSNGRYLLPFKTGAFLAGLPLQPVLLKYEQYPLSATWESIKIERLLWLIMARPPWSPPRVTCLQLPIYYPSPEERADPALYADNMRRYMMKCSEGTMQLTDSTYETKMEMHSIVFKGKKQKGKEE